MAELAARDNRIAVRHARVVARLLALNNVKKDHRKSRVEIEKDAGIGDKQLSNTLQSLADFRKKLKEEVKALRENADFQEYEHCMEETRKKEALEKRMKLEVEDSSKNNEVIAEKWKTALEVLVPQEVARQMAEQKKACDAVLVSKDSVINEIISELKYKDEEYQITIEQQSKDINDLCTIMACQVATLTDTYRNELINIEFAFLEQRATLLANNKEEMSKLIQERCDMEAKFQDDMMAKKEEFAKCLEDIRDVDGEEYNNLKVRLETDMQTLEQHHATMQAMYQFNAEKLEYNHLVLVERDRENYITSNQQKRKLNRQRDSLVLLKGRYNDLEKCFSNQNSTMGHGFAQVTKLLQDLQNKEHKLLHSHAVIRRNFFLMHQRNLSVLVSKILQADKDIHENQLGWHWQAPSDQVFIDLGSDEVLNNKKKAEPEIASDLATTMSDEKYSTFLGTLCDEAFFLVDKKTRDQLSTLVPAHQDWVQCVSILHALGIKNGASLEKLKIVLKGQEFELKDNDINKNLSIYLHNEAELVANTVAVAEIVESNPKATLGTRLNKEGIKKLKWENYWKSFTTVINSKTLRVWGHLEQGLIAYKKLLNDRVFLTSEVISLRQQNHALLQALHHCLKGKK